ncbi:MAG: DUF4440 domain-containing protein [Candidatus Marinimicrobia bacterium]|nr:DUF4440 domain-containing protein [Candidatus Neomarinimicrobiota bacterium]MCF7850230.1 DUF4440 domain-containing protein [Candidatus Neomarinimicrobiota bacterium]MCF7903728.1 DUF4440 domain-containing protein [Candidatus Neomarinimicrobiota bacterium]
MTEKERLLETDKQFAALSIESGSAEAFRHFLAEDAMGMPQGQHPIMGRDAIYADMKTNSDSYILSWEPQRAEVSESRDMGWTWGNWMMSLTDDDGIEQKRYGKYINIWERQPSGEWRVVVDLGNSSPAPE